MKEKIRWALLKLLIGAKWEGMLKFGKTSRADMLVVKRGHLSIRSGESWEIIAIRKHPALRDLLKEALDNHNEMECLDYIVCRG